jgi:hypothetical protein
MHPGMSRSKLPYMNIDIRRIAHSGLVTAFTGHAVGRYGFGDAQNAVDRASNVLVPDSQNKFIYKVTPRGLTKVLAGSGQFGSADGPAPSVSFNQPSGIAVDRAGNVYVGDTAAIRKLVPGGEVFGRAPRAR